MCLPGLLAERMFVTFDIDKDGYLSKQELVDGLIKLFQDIVGEGTKLVFSLLDFDHDGFVTLEDMTTLCSHIPTLDLITPLQLRSEVEAVGPQGNSHLDYLYIYN
jgi:hypothetical protein